MRLVSPRGCACGSSTPGMRRPRRPASSAARGASHGDGARRRSPWASVTKLLTGLTFLVALEEGTVDLDEPAGPPGSTLRHLLSHASGLPLDGAEPIAGARPPAHLLEHRHRGRGRPPRRARRDAVRRLLRAAPSPSRSACAASSTARRRTPTAARSPTCSRSAASSSRRRSSRRRRSKKRRPSSSPASPASCPGSAGWSRTTGA